MIVHIEELVRVKHYLRRINNTPIGDINWVYKGLIMDIPEDLLEEWRYVGLNNSSFIESGCRDEEIISLFKNKDKE